MASEEAGLLEDICTRPDDVAARLVYADWLDERGHKGDAQRAEFIRLQCRLDSRESLPADERQRLEQREKALLQEWSKVWLKPLRGCFSRHQFRRGFVERATMQARVFLDKAETILSLTPLRFLKLRSPRDHIRTLAQAPILSRLEGLSLNYGQLGAARTRVFLSSPHLHHLTWLDLGNNNIGLPGLMALLQAADHLPRLRTLALDDCTLRDVGIHALSIRPMLARLEVLNLDGNDLTDLSLHSLAWSPHTANLKQLHLMRNRGLTPGGLRELLNAPHCGLRKVFLNDTGGALFANREALRAEFAGRVELDHDSWMDTLEM